MLPGFDAIVKLPATVRAMLVVWLNGPYVPVTMTVAGPIAAVGPAASVSVLPLAEDVGLNVAVTPAGKPLAEKATTPAKPLTGFTVILDVLFVL